MKPSTAILIFGLASGVASGVAQVSLNRRIKDLPEVDKNSVYIAAGISFAVTFLSVYLITKSTETRITA